MKIPPFILSLAFLMPVPCLGEPVFCGTVERAVDVAPDDSPGAGTRETLVLLFREERNVTCEEPGEAETQAYSVRELRIVPSGETGDIARISALTGKSACFSGHVRKAHGTRHAQPLQLILPRLPAPDEEERLPQAPSGPVA